MLFVQDKVVYGRLPRSYGVNLKSPSFARGRLECFLKQKFNCVLFVSSADGFKVAMDYTRASFR